MKRLDDIVDGIKDRRDEILAAAYELFTERGFAGTTMLAVAQRAKASKETLYAWFANKDGLYRALIDRRMEHMASLSAEAAQGLPDAPRAAFLQTACNILSMLCMPSTIAVIRIAMTESARTPDLGRSFVEAGVAGVRDIAAGGLAQCRAAGLIAYADSEQAELAEMFIGLLCGEWRSLLIMGQMPPPGPEAVKARAERAVAIMLKGLTP